jgi:hypothetical protein
MGDSVRASMRLTLCACVFRREHAWGHNKNLEANSGKEGSHGSIACGTGCTRGCLVVQSMAADTAHVLHACGRMHARMG